MSNTLPAIFFGHDNPMNAVSNNFPYEYLRAQVMTAALRPVFRFALQVSVCQMQDFNQAEIGYLLNLFFRECNYWHGQQ